MAPSVEVFDPKMFEGAVADEILASIEERLTEKPSCSVALCGGNTPSSVYRALSKPPRVNAIDWKAVSLFWGDERWVPHDDDQSNFRMVQETLLSQLKGDKPKVYPVDTSLDSFEAGAQKYSEVVREALAAMSTTRSPQFDVVLLGMGEDGHTASLFPGSPVIHRNDALCYPVTSTANGSQRVTLSAELLFSAWKVFFIVKGVAKADIVKRVIEGSESAEVLPSRLFASTNANVSFLLDSEAAKKLSH